MLTRKQIDCMIWIYQEGFMDVDDDRVHGNTKNSLQEKGMVTQRNYANRSVYELTDKGLLILDNH